MPLTPAEEKLAKIAPISERAVVGFDKALEESEKGNKESTELTEKENKEQDQRQEQQQEEQKKAPEQKQEEQVEQKQEEQEQQEEQKEEQQQQQTPDSTKVLAEKFDKLIETLTPKSQPKQEQQQEQPKFQLYEVDDQLMEQVLEGGEVGKKALTKAIQVAAIQGAQMAIQVVTEGFKHQIAPLQQTHAEQRVKAAEDRYVTLYPDHKEMLDLGRQVAFRMLQTDPSWGQKPQDEFFKAVHDQVDTIVQLVKKNGGDVKTNGEHQQQEDKKAEQRTTPPKVGGGGARGAAGSSGGKKLTSEQEMMKEMQEFAPRQGRS